jgi:F-type H+-transporting ATPase subunit b
MELLKLLSANEIVAQILSFLVLFFLLRAFFWKRILKLLDDRKEKVASELKHIEDEKAEIEKIKSDYQDRLKSIEAAAQARMQEVVREGEKIGEEIKKGAHLEAEKVIRSAKEDAQREIAKAKEKLEGDIEDLVMDATQRLLKEKVTEEGDRRMVRDFLDELEGKK